MIHIYYILHLDNCNDYQMSCEVDACIDLLADVCQIRPSGAPALCATYYDDLNCGKKLHCIVFCCQRIEIGHLFCHFVTK